jgi:ankyrin repeat protein
MTQIDKMMESALNGYPNIQNIGGNTALMYATGDGLTDIVKLLLDRGADPNIVDQYGQTALVYATRNCRRDIVVVLLDNGIDPNIVEIYGRTALMVAIISGSTDIVGLLLDKGTDPNIVDIYGQTALISASLYGHTDIVKLIKDHIDLQKALQNLALAKSMNSPECDSPLQYLDYDIMKEIMICKRAYNHGVQLRMKGSFKF